MCPINDAHGFVCRGCGTSSLFVGYGSLSVDYRYVFIRIMKTSWHGYGFRIHYDDVIMGTMASQITSLKIVYSTVYSDADQRKHQSSASLAFVRGIHRGPVNSPHKWPVARKMFPFDAVIMLLAIWDGTPSVTDEFFSHWKTVVWLLWLSQCH